MFMRLGVCVSPRLPINEKEGAWSRQAPMDLKAQVSENLS